MLELYGQYQIYCTCTEEVQKTLQTRSFQYSMILLKYGTVDKKVDLFGFMIFHLKELKGTISYFKV